MLMRTGVGLGDAVPATRMRAETGSREKGVGGEAELAIWRSNGSSAGRGGWPRPGCRRVGRGRADWSRREGGFGGLAVGEENDGRETLALDALKDVADDGGYVGGVALGFEGAELGEAGVNFGGGGGEAEGLGAAGAGEEEDLLGSVRDLSQAASLRVAVARS